MKKPGQSSGRRGRSITVEEEELWEQATRTLLRVKAKARVAVALSPQEAQQDQGAANSPGAKPGPQHARSERTGAPRAVARPPVVAAPEVLDRRQMRRIAAGKTDIDAHIDLHGLRQAEAHARLRAFLANASAAGLKTVLVITGKGAEVERADPLLGAMGESQRGVLRRNVPLWLGQPDLSHLVLSYGTAGMRHGAGGAFYVRLRKPARST